MPRLLKIPADFFAEIYSDNVPYWIRFLLTSPVQEKYLPARHVIIINNRKVDSFSSESCCDQHEVCDAPLPFLLVFFHLLLGKNNRELGSMYPSYVLWTWMIYHFWNSCWKPADLLTNAADFFWDGWSFAPRRSYWIQEESWNSDRVETGDWRCLLTMCVFRWEGKTFVVTMIERANRLLVNEMQSSSVHDLVSCIFQSLPHLSVLDRFFWWASKETHGVVRLCTPVC